MELLKNSKFKMFYDLYNKANGNVDIDALFKVCFLKDFGGFLSEFSNEQWSKYRNIIVNSYDCFEYNVKKRRKKIVDVFIKTLKEENETTS